MGPANSRNQAGTDPDQTDSLAVALELERLRGSLDSRLARVDGSLALVVQRCDQTDRQLADHERRVESLERSRWPLASIGVLAAIATAVVTFVQLTAR
ncbi:hypothetical protein [Streptomyces sp. NPDC088794]|uniref:hypothetical protein n=1 Tax=Streptomyces sp. NPDC088794 TaxID=3365902 RepID=UPI003827BF01